MDNGGETHFTYLYVTDPAGNVRETFLPSAEASDIAADVTLLLKGKKAFDKSLLFGEEGVALAFTAKRAKSVKISKKTLEIL